MSKHSSGDAPQQDKKTNQKDQHSNVQPGMLNEPYYQVLPDSVARDVPFKKHNGLNAPPPQLPPIVVKAKEKQGAPKNLKSSQSKPELLKPGITLKTKWKIIKKIGNGGFGSIYEANNLVDGESVAIKTEELGQKWPFLRMELDVLRKLQGKPNVATFKACGRYTTCNYIIMQLLGKNVQEIRKSMTEERFTMPTAFIICQQMLIGLRSIHESGYIHRDLKPANFAIGHSEGDRTIYILDFGLCRTHISDTGAIKPPRKACGFRGTVRYASINIHEGRDMGRHDDMWSLFYILIEMLTGNLPWRSYTEKEDVLKLKKQTDLGELIKTGPPQLTGIYKIIRMLDYYTTPQYGQIYRLLEEMLTERNVNKATYQYDWVRHSKRSSVHSSISKKLKSSKIAKEKCNIRQHSNIAIRQLGFNERAMSAIEDRKHRGFQRFPSTIAPPEQSKR